MTLKTFYKRQSGSTCECGVGDRKRIVGGSQAHQNAYPWLVAIYWTSGDLICGGSVINPNYVLSASHCFPGVKANDIFVVLGDYDRGTTADGPATQMVVEKIIMHERFGLATKVDSDIALVKTRDTIAFSEKIQPICLPTPAEIFIGQTGVVAGWGTTTFGGTESNMLLEINVPILKDDICKENFTKFYDSSNMMCAGHLEGGKDACQGDSGGPLVIPDKHDIYTVAGVISYGRGCATVGYPGVYAKVTSFLSWINEKTTGSPICRKPNKEPKATCGEANNHPRINKRIAGGLNTSPHQYPWTAVLIITRNGRNQLRCGATILSESWIVTSGRCVYGVQMTDLSVVVGEYDIKKYDGTEVQRFFDSVYIHPNFDSNSAFTHDIALLKVKTPLVFDQNISPVCLPPKSWDEASLIRVEGVATGWGTNSKGEGIEQQVFMQIISNQKCRVSYGPGLTSAYLCAGGIKGEDICNQDFGGQFSVTSIDGLYRLVGISAFSEKDNCGNGHPAGFTRITAYLNWIHQTAGLVIDE
uniref:Peptidase S1 domain-containing protein n=1 Tax=Strigamia maritima TaxID=126957 RepID=T1IT26_STRMM